MRPVLLWHGAQDRFSPVGHFGALDALPAVLDWLCAPPQQTTS
ncbi:hypothetical protein [Streptomyces canus]